MKKRKNIMCLILAAVMTFSVGFAVNGTDAKAADKISAPKTVRCGVGEYNRNSVVIPLASNTYTVKNVKAYKGKTKTTNLVVKKTYTSRSETNPYVGYSVYAKKAGTYTVKYDVYANGKKKGKTKSFTVKASGYGDAISSVTINKKNVTKYVANYQPTSYYTTKNKIKVKFKAASGCKIKKIEMTYYDKNGKEVTKRVKNGSTVTLGKYAESYSYGTSSGKSLWASTRFTITYVDKYDQYDSKEKQTTSYTVYKRATKWYKDAE